MKKRNVKVVATKPHKYDGQKYGVGDEYACPEKHAVALAAAGSVRLLRRGYRRRDMVAEA